CAMAIELRGLLEHSFFDEEVKNASEVLQRVADQFQQTTQTGARMFEVVVPDEPDEQWLRDGLVQPLVYFCESEAAVLPKCAGVVVAMFIDAHLYAISAEDVIAWASDQLGSPIEQLRQSYGTRETE